MKRYGAMMLALAFVALFAACSSQDDQTPTEPAPGTDTTLPEPAPETEPAPAPEAEPTPAPAPEAAPEAAPETAPETAEPTAAAGTLVGSTWKIGEFMATFKDDTTVSLKGGVLSTIAPDGLDAKYTLNDGQIEVSAMGSKKTGTFDGTNLIIDGDTAVRQQ